MGQATTGRMKLTIAFLLSGLLAYASAASSHRREPMESPNDHLHDVGVPAMVRDDHRRVHMETAADHVNDVQGRGIGNETQKYSRDIPAVFPRVASLQGRSDHRGEAMETANDHAHDVGAPAMDRNDHRGEPMETIGDHANDVSGK